MFDPWVGKVPWRRKWQPTPVFLPGEPHGQRSVVGYSPRGCKESDMTERLHFVIKNNYSEIKESNEVWKKQKLFHQIYELFLNIQLGSSFIVAY